MKVSPVKIMNNNSGIVPPWLQVEKDSEIKRDVADIMVKSFTNTHVPMVEGR